MDYLPVYFTHIIEIGSGVFLGFLFIEAYKKAKETVFNKRSSQLEPQGS